MARRFSLAHLTVMALPPPQVVAVAAKAGYQYAGLRLLPSAPGGPGYPLMDQPDAMRETLARMQDTGVEVFDLEIIRIGPDTRAGDYLAFFATGQQLGARAVLVAGDDPDEGRLTATFAALCEAARPFGLSIDLEFMSWAAVRDARTALRVAEAAGQPNGGVLVDALHVLRSATTPADVAAIPRARLHYAQICDGPADPPDSLEAMIHTARFERLLPGEGGADLAGIFGALPRDLPVSVELPSETRAPGLGPEEWARVTLQASREALDVIDRGRAP